jgi:transcriptional regulator with XRE-family HTH domain
MTSRTGDGAQPLDARAELSEFLRTRRARLRPDDVGVRSYGGRRRVPGLRREELAQLAGVSVAYYTRLEQGNGRNVSAEVLDAVASALRLDDSERAHLFHLAKPQRARDREPDAPQRVRPEVQEMLDALDGVPAYVWGRRADVLAWNEAAAALFDPWFRLPDAERSWAAIVFLNAGSREFFVDWDAKAAEVIAQLRLDAGLHGDDPRLTALVDEAQQRSPEFRRLWSAHDVRRYTHGEMWVRHEVVGELLLRYETLLLPDDRDQALTVYRAAPGVSYERLRELVGHGPGRESEDDHRAGGSVSDDEHQLA